MVTRDVLKVLKLHTPTARAILRTFKAHKSRNAQAGSYDFLHLERFSNECRKTKSKVITLANQKERRQSSKPIKTRSNYT